MAKQENLFHLFFVNLNPWAPQSSIPIMNWIYPRWTKGKLKKHLKLHTQLIKRLVSKNYQHSIIQSKQHVIWLHKSILFFSACRAVTFSLLVCSAVGYDLKIVWAWSQLEKVFGEKNASDSMLQPQSSEVFSDWHHLAVCTGGGGAGGRLRNRLCRCSVYRMWDRAPGLWK